MFFIFYKTYVLDFRFFVGDKIGHFSKDWKKFLRLYQNDSLYKKILP